jgi:hypothetical protein
MKGLILSLAFFVLYVLSTAAISHLGRFERHSKLFLPAIAIWIPIYFAAYFLTPATLGFLSAPWMATHRMLDAICGCAVLLLNIHSYIDFFFGFNGGFSTSMMLLLLAREPRGATAEELIAEYRDKDGRDKIHGWRLPRLAETGYLRIDPHTQVCTLTDRGRTVARFTRFLKTILTLGRGG